MKVSKRDCLSRSTRAAALLLGVSLSLTACATVPYERGRDLEGPATLKLAENEPQIERGRPHRLVDGMGHYVFSLPSKLLLLSWSVDNHDISEETEAAIVSYLEDNGLQNVKVRLNQYNPSSEWDRLLENPEVNGFWRYTLGALTVAVYTVLPQRLLGGDHYNPFTNTVNLYSDNRAIALHEAAHAKDFAGRRWKGWYSALRLLPVVPLHQEARATGDAIGYERFQENAEGEKRAYRILYPAYGTYLGGEAAQWVSGGGMWAGYTIQLAFVIPAHVVGRIRSLFVRDSISGAELDRLPPPLRAPAEEDALPEP
jgi:hypothetical protein